MEKQVRDFEVDYELDWEYSVSIEKLEEDIKELKKLGATKVCIEAESSYDVATICFIPITSRVETNEEYEKRVKTEKVRNDYNEQRDLETLARLKAKYEN
jgi:hypothetical protein